MRHLTLALLLLSCSLSAAVVTGGGGVKTPDDDTTLKVSKQPAWVDDPTQGGKVKAAVMTWASGADRDTQRQARKDAVEKLRTTFALPATAKIKEKDTWTDPSGATFTLLVVR